MVPRVDRRQTRPPSAFWVMTRRVCAMAGCVDLALLIFFAVAGSPFQACLNVFSVALYACAYWLLRKRRNLLALVLICTEVVVHVTLGTLMAGWGTGFHYYLLMFIPAIVVSGGWRQWTLPLVVLFAGYLGLHTITDAFAPLEPLSKLALKILNAYNIAIFFGMVAYAARYYYELERESKWKLRELATRDVLTGLFNRRHLTDLTLSEMIRSRLAGEPLALVLADIDDFKKINDGHGHEAGDLVLTHTSDLFRNACRSQDIIARWGGEEFLFVLPNTGTEGAVAFAERLCTLVADMSVSHAGKSISFTLSMGVAILAPDENLDVAIGRADNALYLSKADGRNRVSLACA